MTINNKEISRLWKAICKELEAMRYFTKEDINLSFKTFKDALLQGDASETIKALEDEKNDRRPSADSKSRCFDFSADKELDELIADLKKFASDCKAQKEKDDASNVKTLGDLMAFLSKNLLNTECGDKWDYKNRISNVLKKIDSNLYAMYDEASEFRLYYDIGLDRESYSRYSGKYHDAFKNPLICRFYAKRSQTYVTEKYGWRTERRRELFYKSFEISKDSNRTTSDDWREILEAKRSEIKAQQDETKRKNDEQTKAFLEGLKSHGFESMDAFVAFCKTATDAQLKLFG